jgi:CBS domain-containing protein
MTVAAILADKGRDVAVTTAQISLAEVSKMLAERKIGALVVVAGKNEIVGIISERDIVRAVAGLGGDALNDLVDSAMTRAVITCSPSDTINDVMEKMTRGRFRHLPVGDDNGRLSGIISIGDVVKAKIEQVEREAEEMRAYIETA